MMKCIFPPFFLIFLWTYPGNLYSQTSSVFGKYVSNWGYDTLIISPDSTFKIIIDGIDITKAAIHYELRGVCKIYKHGVTFVQFDQENEQAAYWSCSALRRKRKKLIRPLLCGPTHRFLIFSKVG